MGTTKQGQTYYNDTDPIEGDDWVTRLRKKVQKYLNSTNTIRTDDTLDALRQGNALTQEDIDKYYPKGKGGR